MILKQVIRYDNAVAIEATWVEEITLPQQEIADGVADLALRKQEVVIKSTAYSGDQMDLFRADVAQYGGDISLYEDLIAQVEADFVPEPPYAPTQDDINAEARAYLNSTDWYVVRFAETGTPIPQDILDARQAARDSIV